MSFDFTLELGLIHAACLVMGWIIGNLSAVKQVILGLVLAVAIFFLIGGGGDAEANAPKASFYGDKNCENKEIGGYDENGNLNVCIRK